MTFQSRAKMLQRRLGQGRGVASVASYTIEGPPRQHELEKKKVKWRRFCQRAIKERATTLEPCDHKATKQQAEDPSLSFHVATVKGDVAPSAKSKQDEVARRFGKRNCARKRSIVTRLQANAHISQLWTFSKIISHPFSHHEWMGKPLVNISSTR